MGRLAPPSARRAIDHGQQSPRRDIGVCHTKLPLTLAPRANDRRRVDLSTMGRPPGGLDLPRLRQFHRGMTRSADELVTEFCKKWSTPDPEELAGYFTEDAVYHNIPMDAVEGREAIKEFIAGFTAGFDGHRLPGAPAGQRRQPGDERAHRRHAAQGRRADLAAGDGGLRDRGRQDRGLAGLLRHGDRSPSRSSVRPAAAPTRCGCRSVSRTSPAGWR